MLKHSKLCKSKYIRVFCPYDWESFRDVLRIDLLLALVDEVQFIFCELRATIMNIEMFLLRERDDVVRVQQQAESHFLVRLLVELDEMMQFVCVCDSVLQQRELAEWMLLRDCTTRFLPCSGIIILCCSVARCGRQAHALWLLVKVTRKWNVGHLDKLDLLCVFILVLNISFERLFTCVHV